MSGYSMKLTVEVRPESGGGALIQVRGSDLSVTRDKVELKAVIEALQDALSVASQARYTLKEGDR